MYENIKAVGLPQWDDADQTLASAVQKELGQPETRARRRGRAAHGAVDRRGQLRRRLRRHRRRVLDGADGDAALSRRTSPGCPGHNWSNAIASATPIAHKGAIAGAKVRGDDGARPAAAPGAGRPGVGLLPQRPDQGRRSTSRSSRPTDLPRPSTEREDDGAVPAGSCRSTTTTRRSTRPTSSSSASRIRP